MSFPAKGTIAYKVCALLREMGEMPISDICDALTDHDRKNVVHITKGLREGNLVERDPSGNYSLAKIMRRHLDQCEKAEKPKEVGQIVPPRTAHAFRPLTAKHMLPRESPRDGTKLREVSFVNGSSGFQVLGYRA